MSYYSDPYQQHPQSGYPPPGGYGYAPPPGPPPSQGYQPGYIAPGGFSNSPYPPPPGPPGGYAPPPGPPPNWNGPPGGYAPPSGPYPPPSSPYPPPNAGYAPPTGPPPSHSPYPPPGAGYPPPPGAPPPGQYNAPPGAPPPAQYHAAPSSYGPPTYLGTNIPPPPPARPGPPVPGYDPTPNVEKLRKATKGFGTDESAIISVMAPLNAFQVDALSRQFEAQIGKQLIGVLEKTGGWFALGLKGIALGPVGWDVQLAQRAIAGLGTHEDLLNEIILNRTSEEISILKEAYRATYNKKLEDDVLGDLSMKTKQLFRMALAGQRPSDHLPVDHALVQADIKALHKAGTGTLGTDEIAFCSIMCNRSQPHLVALSNAYHEKRKTTLTKAIKKEFSGHMRDALLYIAESAKKDGRGAWRDAKLLEKAMAGLGTKDERLVWRIVRGHWDKAHWVEVKKAYEAKYKKSLASRVRGETSGDYRKLMLALIE